MSTTTTLTDDQLNGLTAEAEAFMAATGRKNFPSARQVELLSMGALRCSQCHQVKLTSDFNKNRRARTGYRGQCRECNRSNCQSYFSENRERLLEYKVEYHKQNRDRILEYNREYRQENPWAQRLREGYHRAVQAGVPAEWVTQDQLLTYWSAKGINPDTCVYTGASLEFGVNASIDHAVPLNHPETSGHVVSNLVPADLSINSHKGNRPVIHFLADRAEADKKETDQ